MITPVLSDLRSALEAAGVKQTHVARELGLTPKHINQILLGKARPRFELVQQIAALAGVEVVLLPVGHSCDAVHDLLERAVLNTELAELRVNAPIWEARARAAEMKLTAIRAALKEQP